jgi:hypothetical protein
VPDTFTPNLNLTQPQVGGSADTWGNKLNTDLAAIDALWATSGQGTVITRDSSNRAQLGSIGQINGPAATSRGLQFQTALATRWILGEDNSAESGSNAGSAFFIIRPLHIRDNAASRQQHDPAPRQF